MKHNTKTIMKMSKVKLAGVSVLISVLVFTLFSHSVFADKYDDQINSIKQEISQFEAKAQELSAQASTLATAVAKLANERAALQAQLDLSQAKYDKLTADITATEKRIVDNKDALGTILADLYVDDDITPIEMIASSKNISDYIDKQEYRNSVKDDLKNTIDEINALKKSLDEQKKSVSIVLEEQKAQKADIVAKENEQTTLLNNTRGDEAAYRSLVALKDSQVAELRRQQEEEIARRIRESGQKSSYQVVPGSSTNGGYPDKWANAPMNSYVDNWGMYSRQCVSYAAYMVWKNYGNMPYWGGFGNANQWTGNAYSYGIPVGKVPKAGSVGVIRSGAYGHVAWVDSVQSNGTITIDHYNVNWAGKYARWTNVPASMFDEYIYFGEW